MKNIILSIFIFLPTIVCQLNGQDQYAELRTELDFINDDMSYYIELNGVDLSHNNRTYSVAAV